MSEIEYHGWIVLASSRNEWADDDWDHAWSAIDDQIKGFGPEDGHAVTVTEPTNAMRTLSFHGLTEDAPERLLRLMEFVAGVLDASYGELIITPGAGFDWRTARRYRLSGGRVKTCDS
jgi:hypothetical protein